MSKITQIKEFILLELRGWSKTEVLALGFIVSLILISAFILKDSTVAVISAICGCMYTIMAGKGKISCYIFGLCGSGCYSYLSFANALYGNLLLYLCYYIPMEIIGIFKWKNNLKSDTNEIIKTKLTSSERIKLGLLTAAGSAIMSIVLIKLNDTQPVKDALTTVLSVVGMYLTVRRCIEQWLIWIVVNGISFVMWIYAVMNGAKAYATVIMWAFYFAAAIYFYVKWKNELDKTLPND